ncbi:hypothetical protein SSPO_001130 [Streptomyces antimycoticus]|uniref:Uncharacterized protein n=1 Tax=Streptomyces antimycoticus TaxID=68175 RepID=A0A499UA15_9ACTN|nr:hypothetical protein [Streptomyces antimycoticus]BBJ37395.1 hypothetical protein SSPO_001130 [Streptomyces antimycoticus]
MLNDKDVLEAVRRRLEGRGDGVKLGLPDTARVTWHPLLEGQIVRCIETCRQDERLHYGSIDLSDQPEYDTLSRYRLAPPKDLTRAQKVTLVRRGSVTERSCDGCSNGKNPCPRCQGRGDLPCEPSTACADCRGADSCLRCEGTGHKIRNAPDSQQPAGERVPCRRCGALDAACPTCCGRGHTTCMTCDGRGVRDCPECDRAGTVLHQSCQGAGRTVTWTEATISRTPMTEPVKHPKAGVPYPARELARTSGKWHRVRLTDKETLPKDLTDEFRNLAQSYLAPHEDEIGREATFKYLRLARVEAPQHPHRVYYVFPTNTSPQVVVLPSQQRTWQITAAALGALLVLFLLLRLVS